MKHLEKHGGIHQWMHFHLLHSWVNQHKWQCVKTLYPFFVHIKIAGIYGCSSPKNGMYRYWSIAKSTMNQLWIKSGGCFAATKMQMDKLVMSLADFGVSHTSGLEQQNSNATASGLVKAIRKWVCYWKCWVIYSGFPKNVVIYSGFPKNVGIYSGFPKNVGWFIVDFPINSMVMFHINDYW